MGKRICSARRRRLKSTTRSGARICSRAKTRKACTVNGGSMRTVAGGGLMYCATPATTVFMPLTGPAMRYRLPMMMSVLVTPRTGGAPEPPSAAISEPPPLSPPQPAKASAPASRKINPLINDSLFDPNVGEEAFYSSVAFDGNARPRTRFAGAFEFRWRETPLPLRFRDGRFVARLLSNRFRQR